jgi:hypothetical protein
MKPKARQIVFLEYEQSGCESPPGIALSDRYRENSTSLLKSMTLSVTKSKSRVA